MSRRPRRCLKCRLSSVLEIEISQWRSIYSDPYPILSSPLRASDSENCSTPMPALDTPYAQTPSQVYGSTDLPSILIYAGLPFLVSLATFTSLTVLFCYISILKDRFQHRIRIRLDIEALYIDIKGKSIL